MNNLSMTSADVIHVKSIFEKTRRYSPSRYFNPNVVREMLNGPMPDWMTLNDKLEDIYSNYHLLSQTFAQHFEAQREISSEVDDYGDLIDPGIYLLTITYKNMSHDASEWFPFEEKLKYARKNETGFFERLLRGTVSQYHKHPEKCPVSLAFLDKPRSKDELAKSSVPHTHAIVIVPPVTIGRYESFIAERKWDYAGELTRSVLDVDSRKLSSELDLLRATNYSSKTHAKRTAQTVFNHDLTDTFMLYGPTTNGERLIYGSGI